MIVDFNAVLHDLDGEVIRDPAAMNRLIRDLLTGLQEVDSDVSRGIARNLMAMVGPPQEMTLGSIARAALMSQGRDDEHMSGDTKYRYYELAVKTKEKGGRANLSLSDRAEIQARIEKLYGPLIVGLARRMLDTNTKDEA